jgi:hypothetical protein
LVILLVGLDFAVNLKMTICQATTRKNNDIRIFPDGVVVASPILAENVLPNPLLEVFLGRKSHVRPFISVSVDNDLPLHDSGLPGLVPKPSYARRTTAFPRNRPREGPLLTQVL